MYTDYITPEFCLQLHEDCTEAIKIIDYSEIIALDTNLGEYVEYDVKIVQEYNGIKTIVPLVNDLEFQKENIFHVPGDRDTIHVTIYCKVWKYNPTTGEVDIVYNYTYQDSIQRDCCCTERGCLKSDIGDFMAKEGTAYIKKGKIGRDNVKHMTAMLGMSNLIWTLDHCSITCTDVDDLRCLFNKLKVVC